MKKFLLVAILALVLALVGFALFIDPLVENAIERGGTYALGIDTHVDEVDVGLISGDFALRGLAIDNPPGFDVDEFLRLSAAEMDLSLASLASRTIEVPRLELRGIALDVERGSDGTNYGVILDRLKLLDSEAGASSERSAPEAGKRFIVKVIIVSNMTVTFNLLASQGPGTRMTLRIPNVTLRDIGSGEGQSLGSLLGMIVQALLAAAADAGRDVLPADALENLRRQLEGLPAITAEVSKEITSQVEEILEHGRGELGKAAKEAGQALEGAGEELGDRLKNLLDGQR